MYAHIRGTSLYFDVDGAGQVVDGDRMADRPVVFLLHGGPGGDHSSFKTQVSELRDTVQLVYVDHRGSGRSAPADPSTYTLDENAEDLEALRAYLGLERISILGSSYGGMVAQGYAIRFPERTANLVLSSTASSYRFLAEARRFVEEHGSPEQIAVCQRLWDGTFESSGQLYEYYKLMGPMYSTRFDVAQFEYGWQRGIRNFEQLNLGFGGFLRTFDFSESLSQITCPTLVLAGAHDWICSVQQSELLAERIPRAHLKVFPHSAHAIAVDEHEAYLAALRGFFTYAGV